MQAILKFSRPLLEANGGEYVREYVGGRMPVIQYCENLKPTEGRRERSLTVAPAEMVYDAAVFVMLLEFLSSSVGIRELMTSVGGCFSLPSPRAEGTTHPGLPASFEIPDLSLDPALECHKTTVDLRMISVVVALADSRVPTVGMCIEKLLAVQEDNDRTLSVRRVGVSCGEVEFMRVENSRSSLNCIEVKELRNVRLELRNVSLGLRNVSLAGGDGNDARPNSGRGGVHTPPVEPAGLRSNRGAPSRRADAVSGSQPLRYCLFTPEIQWQSRGK